MLQGGKIAGGGKKSNRVPFEFYATNPKAVEMLMQKLPLKGLRILDCCVGGGNIAKALKNFSPDNDVVRDRYSKLWLSWNYHYRFFRMEKPYTI